MRLMILITMLAVTIILGISLCATATVSFAMEGCAQDCVSCHSLKQEEAQCMIECAEPKLSKLGDTCPEDSWHGSGIIASSGVEIRDISMMKTAGLWKVYAHKDGQDEVFTGDKAGRLLYEGLYKTGFANRLQRDELDPRLKLRGVLITNAVLCALPDNKPSAEEFANCRRYLEELLALPSLKGVLCLGGQSFREVARIYGLRGAQFAHGARYEAPLPIYTSYHPSGYNISTGRIRPEMLREVLERIKEDLALA